MRRLYLDPSRVDLKAVVINELELIHIGHSLTRDYPAGSNVGGEIAERQKALIFGTLAPLIVEDSVTVAFRDVYAVRLRYLRFHCGNSIGGPGEELSYGLLCRLGHVTHSVGCWSVIH